MTRRRLPQELVDAILGEFDISQKFNAEYQDALKSCALVARSFVCPSQTRLFARTCVRDPGENTSLPKHQSIPGTIKSQWLAGLLSTSPHIASYIRTLDLYYDPAGIEAKFVSTILGAATALHTLILAGHSHVPLPMSPSIVGVFSLPSLRRVELCGYHFDDPPELECLLRKAKGLQDLTLRAVYFRKYVRPTAVGDIISNAPSGVALEKLTLVEVERQDVDSMLDLFTTVDIRCLKSLSLVDTDITRLLHANAQSLQILKLGQARYSQAMYEDDPDPKTMAGAAHLHLVEIEAEQIWAVDTFIPVLGDLKNLTALKTLRITLVWGLEDTDGPDQWSELDELLQQALPGGVQVEVYATFGDAPGRMDKEDVERVEEWMPLLAGSGALHVYRNTHFDTV
ncbi:hypothetical protein B0H14DRAFT_1049988 [Mycena olivaceomarginata]|nr:hypothetical protein B0H14DRAFT_1049988 [Mycena olivaceomarginata]